MFPEKIGDSKFEALLKCERCGWDKRALYRKPVRSGSGFYQNVVWDDDEKKFLETNTSKCPKCNFELMRKLYRAQ